MRAPAPLPSPEEPGELTRLRQSQRVLRSVVEALDGALCIVGADGRVLDANRRWTDRVTRDATSPGAPPGSVGTDFYAWCATARGFDALGPQIARVVGEVVAGDTADGVPDRQRAVKGRVGDRWVVVRVHPIGDHDDARAVVVLVDITEGMRTQEQLRRATEDAQRLARELERETSLLAGILSAVPQAVHWKDGEGRYVGCNAAYCQLRGVRSPDELVGRTDADLGAADPFAVALRALEAEVAATGRAVVDRRTSVPGRAGDPRTWLLSVLPQATGTVGVGADITHASELERQLAQANRLQSIGQLAAGIAHEINTPVQYVADNTRFVAEATLELLRAVQQLAAASAGGRLPEVAAVLDPLDLDFLGDEIPGALSGSREGLARVAEVVRAMKDYAHPGSGRADTDVNRAIESTVSVCRNEWKYVARLELDLDPAAGTVPCYEGDLKQVILNIVVNAAQAIAEDTRTGLGTIRVTTRRTADEFVISVADDGPGMTDAVREHVFDPFFTTKDVGLGTGQGLNLAHAVVVGKHQGRLDLDTAPGRGATFTIRLPLTVPEEIGVAGAG